MKRGQPIACIGNSGASGMPHLHFALLVWEFPGDGLNVGIGVPYRFSGFRIVGAGGKPCSVQVTCASTQEGWGMEFPEPAKPAEK